MASAIISQDEGRRMIDDTRKYRRAAITARSVAEVAQRDAEAAKREAEAHRDAGGAASEVADATRHVAEATRRAAEDVLRVADALERDSNSHGLFRFLTCSGCDVEQLRTYFELVKDRLDPPPAPHTDWEDVVSRSLFKDALVRITVEQVGSDQYERGGTDREAFI
jgi:hypothetical protein